MPFEALVCRMRSTHRFLLAGTFVAGATAAGVLAAPSLPDQMVVHWNAAGEPDGTLSKPVALALVPALAAGLLGLFAGLPHVDPRAENVAAFRPSYDWFVVAFTAFLAAVHGGIVAYNLGYAFDFVALLLVALAGLSYAVGVVLAHAERNWFVGIRTPWTLESEAVWRRTHRLGGRLFKLTAVLSLAGLAFGEYAVYFLLVPTLLTAATTVVYSYVLYERLEGTTDGPRGV